jgi:hypothetical protein
VNGQIKDTHIYFPKRLYEQLKKLAVKNRRSMSAEIVIAVEERVTREKEKK